ncbi:hypothetical protein PR048_027788 [Dryococelus australis]|uniref:Uncharacterized protein n=1 Tax=Dryococelus australis TaxID=614101 RepID=A0ABQ9GHH1_9NEOP|nr:hypothetical protein PR048_027788 [Dryococelus australis]
MKRHVYPVANRREASATVKLFGLCTGPGLKFLGKFGGRAAQTGVCAVLFLPLHSKRIHRQTQVCVEEISASRLLTSAQFGCAVRCAIGTLFVHLRSPWKEQETIVSFRIDNNSTKDSSDNRKRQFHREDVYLHDGTVPHTVRLTRWQSGFDPRLRFKPVPHVRRDRRTGKACRGKTVSSTTRWDCTCDLLMNIIVPLIAGINTSHFVPMLDLYEQKLSFRLTDSLINAQPKSLDPKAWEFRDVSRLGRRHPLRKYFSKFDPQGAFYNGTYVSGYAVTYGYYTYESPATPNSRVPVNPSLYNEWSAVEKLGWHLTSRSWRADEGDVR